MADRVFSIDLGSSYTKVALRRDPSADGELIQMPRGLPGQVDFVFPSAVGVERQGGRNVPVFGREVMTRRFQPGALHTDWKKRLFAPPEQAGPPPKPPLDRFLDSPRLVELAAEFGVTSGQVEVLRNLLANARALAGTPAAPPAKSAADRSVVGPLAYHYFRWLMEQVVETCRGLKLDGLDPATIPARVLVPAFAPEGELADHPGCRLLLDALKRAGWRVHPTRPVMSEPYANAIGVLTGGSSVVLKGKAHLGRMFGRCPFITCLKDPAHHPSYRAVVIDVGSFTTDFAAVTLDTQGTPVTDPDATFTVRQQSVRMGVSNLDDRVLGCLPKEKRDWLTSSADLIVLEGFREAVYSRGKPYKSIEAGSIGGGSEAEAVAGELEAFNRELTVEVEKFCGEMGPVKQQELILTGGGCMIPRVRDAVITAAGGGKRTFIKTHAPGLKKGTIDGHHNGFKEDMARGGSALGGASIYFEREYS